MKDKEFYTPEDIKDMNYDRDLGKPGEYPYTRGIYPTMYRGRLWTMRQYAGYGDAYQTNKRFRYLLEKGQTGLSVAFDLPTQLGYDSDHPLAIGEVGRVGVAISMIEDMEELFNRIPLGKVSTSMTINATAPILLGMYAILAESQGADLKNLMGTVQNDILKEYVARGNYIFPVRPSMRLTIDLWEYCIKELPKWHMVSISGYHIREAGSTATQELAFTFANGIAYIEEALKRGLDIDSFGPRISFFFAAHTNLLEEVAKFRAARRIWSRIMRERFKAKNPKSWMLRFHTQTGGCTLTAQQPENNIIRVTLQALAAVLGGTQSLHTNSFDEALALPSEKAVKIALRTQQIIAYESGIPGVIDPLGGSYAIERLTKDIEEEVWEILKRIEELGGAVRVINSGWMQKQIEESAYIHQKRIEEKKRVIVGVNAFEEEEPERLKILKVSERLQRERQERLKRYKEKRRAEGEIERLKRIAEGEGNLMYPIIDCLKKRATLGEICDALREVFGEYRRGD